MRLTAHMPDRAIATCLISRHIPNRLKLDGPACVWPVGHAWNVIAISNHLAPGTGSAQPGHKSVRHLLITQALAVALSILLSTTEPCFQNGLRAAERFGSVRN